MPQLTGHVLVADPDDLYENLGRALLGCAQRAVEERGVFHLALSGGSSPEPFYTRLVTDPGFRAMPWEKTHLWLVDERRVPLDDEKSNWRMICASLLDHVPMRSSQKHPVQTDHPQPAKLYEHELCTILGHDPSEPPESARTQIPRLDFVLLGMGDDCHTASLFPHSPALREHDKLVCLNEGSRVTPPPRITMTYPLLNAARELAVLVTGENKCAAIQRIVQQLPQGPDPVEMPITGIAPIDGEVTWYLDPAAAGQ